MAFLLLHDEFYSPAKTTFCFGSLSQIATNVGQSFRFIYSSKNSSAYTRKHNKCAKFWVFLFVDHFLIKFHLSDDGYIVCKRQILSPIKDYAILLGF